MGSKIKVWKIHVPSYENTCSLGEFDEKPNFTKISKSWNFGGKGYKAKDFFKKTIWQKYYVQWVQNV